MTQPCPDCEAAVQDRLHAIYRATCKGCTARQLAAGPLFWQARCTGKQFEAYRAALACAGVSHEDVKAWAVR